MALHRSVGGLTTIAPGATHYWTYVYSPDGHDVGVAIAAPNLLEEFANIELVAEEQGVFGLDEGDFTGTAYRVNIRNTSAFSYSYNLNIGDWS